MTRVGSGSFRIGNAAALLAIAASLGGGYIPGLRAPERDRPPPEQVQQRLIDKAVAKRTRKARVLAGRHS